MGLGNILFGRKKLGGPKRDRLFAISTAQVTLEGELGLRPAGMAGVVFKPLSAGEFMRAEQEIDELLGVAAQSSGSKVSRRTDSLGFDWIVVRDSELEDLVTTVHLVSSELDARGFGDQLLAALFPFDGRERREYLVYGFKRGTFWPFVPTGRIRSGTTPKRCGSRTSSRRSSRSNLSSSAGSGSSMRRSNELAERQLHLLDVELRDPSLDRLCGRGRRCGGEAEDPDVPELDRHELRLETRV